MAKTISMGELRQNPTRMLREVKAGATYTVTDHGEPVAEITPHRRQRWIPSEEVQELLLALGPDSDWAEELAEGRSVEEARDPWGTIE